MLKISTIIPFKNIREYIEESLESVISQSLTDREIILVDDSSTDGSSEYAVALSKLYDWVKYIRTDNLGPGGARNEGIAIARGKYINFADADDIVPESTYARMYETAERSNADVVIGKAVRLDEATGKIKASVLHEKVFFNPYYETSIKKYPRLVYDTTVWNKMIKRDFWINNGISFPEKTPYQDIPATFKMHYLANKVAMMDKVVYIWRIREGDNKSITQQRSDLDNLRSRLRMMSLVDEYCNDNVAEQELIQEKNVKWLTTDIKAFLNLCTELTDEEMLKVIDVIKPYYNSTGMGKYIKELPILVAEQYKAMLEDNLERLRELRRFEVEGLRDVRTSYKNGSIVGSFPPDIIPDGVANMDTTIDREKLTQRITRITAENNGYSIYGYAFLRHQSVPINGAKLKAKLIRAEGEPVEELRIKARLSRAAAKEGVDSEGKKIRNYYGAGYRIDISESSLCRLKEGRYHVVISWENKGIERTATIRGLTKSQLTQLEETSIKLEDGRHIEIVSTLLKEPEIHISR